jgi:hypothetical protein
MKPTADQTYAEIARAFDELAGEDAHWRGRTRGYHDLITAVGISSRLSPRERGSAST